ncbi:MAG: PAS domain S-box protein, partial [Proteobacteria bacterium]
MQQNKESLPQLPSLSLTMENALEQYSEMEQRLRESEEIARIGSWEFDVGTQKSFWSPATFHLLGFDSKQGEPDLETFRLRFHADDRNKFTETVEKALTSGIPYSIHARIVLEDDSIRWIHIRGRPSQADDGNVTRLRGVVQDITERMQYLADFLLVQEQLKESAEARRRQREYLRSIIDASSDVIFVLDASGVFTLANQTLARNSRLTIPEIVGKRFTDFVHAPGTMERLSDYIVRALSSPDETFLFDEMITLD